MIEQLSDRDSHIWEKPATSNTFNPEFIVWLVKLLTCGRTDDSTFTN